MGPTIRNAKVEDEIVNQVEPEVLLEIEEALGTIRDADQSRPRGLPEVEMVGTSILDSLEDVSGSGDGE